MKISVINGPNINMLGIRQTGIYGESTYEDLTNIILDYSKEKNFQVEFYQSNHEGEIVDYIQSIYKKFDSIVINPAAYTHYSVAILDALSSVSIPYVEVHISDIANREDFRKISITGHYAICTVKGKGFNGYLEAIDVLLERGRENGTNS